ncbi:MAG: glycoside hydrolase family 3 C-terminal domain-containing protein [Hespellia sp.]|nr:glycoside hydrolase family 3 C-terminal domain-containing protein [Hespellia sp.]
MDWKRYRATFQEDAVKILHLLSLEEKVSLMSGAMTQAEVRAAILKTRKTHYNEIPYKAGGLPEYNIEAIRFADGTRGVVCGRGKATCFPVTVMRGASFDIELEEKIGRAIADEVLEAGANLFAGVCVNLPYHPGWGRAQESYGEDSCLLGEMGAALVRGVQETGVIACVKHFAFNSMENARFDVNISCDKRTEREVFLPHFKKCIDAGAGAVMSSYNSYLGKMCGQNHYLLQQVLKQEWGFDGFVMSDFNWGMKDTIEAANSGQDLEMPNTYYYGERLVRAVEEGFVPEEKIDESALRIIRTVLAHQNLISEKWKGNTEKLHADLALQSAREGITLLRNENHVLPMRGEKAQGRIAVLGYLAERENTGDKGSSQVYPPYVVTILQGIIKAAPNAEIIYYIGKSASHCKRLARNADNVIIVAGNDYRDEGEYVSEEMDELYSAHMGGDRVDGLCLKERDFSVITAVSEVREDAIVVLMGGGPFILTDWQDKTGAILMSYYPGMEGGTAVGEVLFGSVNPSGKLPFVIPKKEKNLPDIQRNTTQQTYEYSHGYVLLHEKRISPLYPFGFGLSYTKFQLCEVRIWFEAVGEKKDNIEKKSGCKQTIHVNSEGRICANVRLKNTGTDAGAEVIQMYIGTPGILRAFSRVSLQPEEEKNVNIFCDVQSIKKYDEKTNSFFLEKKTYEVAIGTDSNCAVTVHTQT